MKIALINATCGKGSTGKICQSISGLLHIMDMDSCVYYASGSSSYNKSFRYATDLEINKAALASRIFGNWGFNNQESTKRLIRELEKFAPDIVHIHNIHGHNCDLFYFFKYLKKKNARIVWTFHDCWAFTGYCMHYDMIGCDKWKIECKNCPQKRNYSWFFDNSEKLYTKKKDLFLDLNLTIVTPSEWLCNNVKSSFLKDYPVRVVNNGIDLSIFCPTKSDFRRRYGLEDKHIVLGVAFGWDEHKGLDVFVDLSKRLPDSYNIVLVGTNEKLDAILPNNIISICRTQNPRELAEIYSAADVFVNPTREENYPTVNMEAIACGTPVITFNTGGSAEIIDGTCGIAVDKNDNVALLYEIIRVCEKKPYTIGACLERAKKFDMHKRFGEYIDLYQEVLK